MNTLGHHIVAEFFNCDREILNNLGRMERYMKQAAIGCGATIVNSSFHVFNSHGVSGVIVIAESHFTIHTWPEYGYAAVDVFSCGDTMNPRLAMELLQGYLKSDSVKSIELSRGEVKNQHVLRHKPQHLAASAGE